MNTLKPLLARNRSWALQKLHSDPGTLNPRVEANVMMGLLRAGNLLSGLSEFAENAPQRGIHLNQWPAM